MTFPEERASRLVNEGLRVQPEYRQASGTPEGYPEELEPMTTYTPDTQLALVGPRAVTRAELHTAFDDPEHGEPGRDRFGVHLIWELVLLLAGVGMAFAVSTSHGSPLSGLNLRTLMVNAAIVGVLALGAGVSLRAGAANLAVGPIFVVSGLYYAHYSPDGFYTAAGIAIGIALAAGLVIALVVAVFHVPGWAASLGAVFGILVWETHLSPTAVLTTHYDPAAKGYYWFGGFAVAAILGGILGVFRPIRRELGRFRPINDPADRRGTPAAVITALAVVASALFAGVAGVAFTMQHEQMVSTDGLTFTGTAFGIALLAGTSAFGRRGGIFGTIFATGLFALAIDYVDRHGWRGGELTVVAIALGVGVLVTRLIESYGRPDRSVVADDPVASLGWLGRQQGSWTRELPHGPEDPAYADEAEEHWRTR